MGAIKWTKRRTSPQTDQTPYGTVELERNVDQTSKGARIIRHATPLSHKYAPMNVNAICTDLGDNHGRPVTASSVQNVTARVGSIACTKEEVWVSSRGSGRTRPFRSGFEAHPGFHVTRNRGERDPSPASAADSA